MLISLNEDFQRMRFQKIQAILNLKEIVTNAGVGYLKVEDSIMISLMISLKATSLLLAEQERIGFRPHAQ